MFKLKKIFLLVLAVTLIKIPFSAVCTAQVEESVGNIVYKTNGNKVTASVEVSSDNKKRILVLTAYKDGCMKRITGDSKLVNGTETLTASVDKSDTDKITATVIDAFGGKALTKRAVYGTDSTSLEYIKVNGEAIDYDDETNEYWVNYSKKPVTVEVAVKDGTTKATVSDYELPGNANINVVSASGKQRKIVVHLYNSEDELSKLTGIKYKIGNDVYEISDFNPNTKQYSIAVSDNVMGVTLLPEAMGDVSCTISNENVTEINGVSLGNLYNTGLAAYKYEHNARNNYIPIKNEKTTAYVTVKSGDEKTEYQIDFTAKQPRLTSFEYVGAANDSYKPVFIGGSAVNNDSGTMLSMDRRWSVGNASKALLGGSCFMLPASNKDSNWWNGNTSGEYFNFTADTGGKVYVLSANTIANSEYSGWTKGVSSVELPEGKSWVTVAKDWNDYDAEYFLCVMENQDDYARAISPGIAENEGEDTMQYPAELKNYAYKSFAADEKVSIYHTGKTGQNGAKTIVIIVWDGTIGAAEDPEKPEEPEEPEIPQVIEDENKLMSLFFDAYTDTTKSIWKDSSGYNNHVTLHFDDNNKWTENGLMVNGKSEQAIELPIGINTAINSNVFTLQFELSALNYVDGKKCGVLSSKNGEFEIYKGTNENVYFKWAGNTTSLRMPKITVNQLVGHVNTIVVDKNDEDEAQRIRWYIDGALVANKKMNAEDKVVDKIILSNSDSTYEGNVVFKSLTVYKKALSAVEIAGGGEE